MKKNKRPVGLPDVSADAKRKPATGNQRARTPKEQKAYKRTLAALDAMIASGDETDEDEEEAEEEPEEEAEAEDCRPRTRGRAKKNI